MDDDVDAPEAAAHRIGHRRAALAHAVVTVVDVSWNEEWNGTEHRRRFRIEGDKLFIELAPAPRIVFPGKTDFRRIVWEREN